MNAENLASTSAALRGPRRGRRLVSSRAGRCLLLFVALLGGMVTSEAEGTTVPDVFREVSDIVSEAVLLHDANFSDASGSMVRSDGRQPRHVMQLARTVLRKANRLATINGGATQPIPWMPTWEITPLDLMMVVEPIGRVIRDLKPIFGVEASIKPASIDSRRNTDDVYTALYLLSQLIDGLGIPQTVPNDTYLLADAIVSQLTALVQRYDVPLRPRRADDAVRRTRDVYRRVFDLGQAIERLIDVRPELRPAGGITRSYRRAGRIDQDHVLHVLNDLLAEAVAMRAAIDDHHGLGPMRSASGMNPSDVYARLSDALAIVEDLTEGS